MRSHLLHPLKRSIQSPRPANIKMILTFIGSKIINVLQQPLRVLVDTILKRRCRPSTVNCSFRRCTIVACDINHQSIVGTTRLIDAIKYPFNLCISMCQKSSKYFHQSSSHWFVAIRVRIPTRNLFWPRCELRTFRNNS